MTELWIYKCRDCDLKTWSIGKLGDCAHCGGTMDKVGTLQRSNPTENELTSFFEGLERFRGKQEEDKS